MAIHTRFSRRLALGCALLVLVLVHAGCGRLLTRSEPIRFRSGDGTELAGSLYLPRSGSPPYPGVVVVHGSGPATRDEGTSYAHYLGGKHEMAVLVYDKRGVGQSGGEYGSISVAQSEELLRLLATDASAALDALMAHPEVDPERVGFVGGSQAGWIIPLAADGRDDVAFLAVASAATVSYGIEIEYSELTGDDPGRFEPGELSDDEIRARLARFDGPHGFEPLPILERMSAPSLWVLGERDRSVPTFECRRVLEELRSGLSVPMTIEMVPNADHSLRDRDSGERFDFRVRFGNWLTEIGVLAAD